MLLGQVDLKVHKGSAVLSIGALPETVSEGNSRVMKLERALLRRDNDFIFKGMSDFVSLERIVKRPWMG